MGGVNFKSLKTRLLSAVVLIPVVLWIIWTGQKTFTALLIVAACMTLYEWWEMARKMPKPRLMMALGVAYILASYLSYYLLREWFGFGPTMLCMISVWASDSGAYFAGKFIGGPKMAPNISPNKTWAGFAGAVLGPVLINIVLSSGFAFLSFQELGNSVFFMIPFGVILGSLIGCFGQGGDLLISLIKRKSGVKDTGRLIPGHGGILDRIDSLMPNAILFFLLFYFLR